MSYAYYQCHKFSLYITTTTTNIQYNSRPINYGKYRDGKYYLLNSNVIISRITVYVDYTRSTLRLDKHVIT